MTHNVSHTSYFSPIIHLIVDLARVPERCCKAVVMLSFAACCALMAPVTSAQNIQYTENKADQALRARGRINPSSLAMELSIPLGSYPGRNGVSVPIVINYTSKVWRIDYMSSFCTHSIALPVTQTRPVFAENSAAGWTSSMDVPRLEYTGEGQLYDFEGKGYNFNLEGCGDPDPSRTIPYYVKRITIHLPDGSSHELRKDDSADELPQTTPSYDWTGKFYAVDGSRLIFDFDTNKLYLPDGSRYIFANVNHTDPNFTDFIGTQYMDRNGNKLIYNPTTKQWTDTLGRILTQPLPLSNHGLQTQTVGDFPYSVPGVGNTPLTYTLSWRYLKDPNTGESVLADPNQELHWDGGRSCQAQVAPTLSPTLFASDHVERICGTQRHNPIVLSKVMLPNGRAYEFKYNVYGEIVEARHPTGASERFEYAAVTPFSAMDPNFYGKANRGVTNHRVGAGGGAAESLWQYTAGYPPGQLYTVRTTDPNNTITERLIHAQVYTYCPTCNVTPFGFGNVLVGMPYEERARDAAEIMLRRKLTEWTITNPAGIATRGPRVTKEVSIILDPGGNALATTTTHQHDGDLNVISSSRYDFVSVTPTTAQTAAIDSSSFLGGTLLRTEETTFLVNDTNISQGTRDSYRAQNLIGLPTSTRVWNGLGTLVAKGELKYDEGGLYTPLTCGAVNGWSDPGLAKRGQATTAGRWLKTTDTWLESHAQFDQCGSLRKSWDARGYVSEVEYAGANDYAYPTRTISPDPDGPGPVTPLETTTVYDRTTGVPLSTTDANGKITRFEYSEFDALSNPNPFQRLTKVIQPDGGSTAYGYSDAPGNIYVVTKTALDSSRYIESTQYVDGLGRAWRASQLEGATSISVDTEYDGMGRVWKVSNPYRTGDTAVWTTTGYDALSRVISVTTGGAEVGTAYSGSTSGTLGPTVTVTDQALKKRKSVTDALGRLREVYEDPTDLNHLTSYSYDALDNLTTVAQGTQTRIFDYDSLKRLTAATNPESGKTDYTYDANGNLLTKTDARLIVSTYEYDALNRNTTVVYTNDPGGTPSVKRYYDGWRDNEFTDIPNVNGRLWQTEISGANGSRTTINSFDSMGRPLSQSQQFYAGGEWRQPYTVQRTPYNLAGGVTSQTYPSENSVTYNYDQAGRLGDKDIQNLAFAGTIGGEARTYSRGITYTPLGSIAQEQFGTDVAIYNKLAYNSRGQLTEIKESTTPNDSSWNRGKFVNWYSLQCGTTGSTDCNAGDNNGNLRKQETLVPNSDGSSTSWYQQYEYDSLNRLEQVHEHASNNSLLWRQSFTYDQYGNRKINVNATSGGVNNTSFEVETATNRLLAPDDLILTGPNLPQRKMRYDDAGNLINDSWSSYGSSTPGVITRTYDAENRMTSAWESSGGISYYTYNADGQRVRRKNISVETWQIYGMDGELLAEYPQNGAVTSPQKEYGYRNGQLLIVAEMGALSAAPPTALAATLPSTGASPVTLSWSIAAGATNYRVERKGAGESYGEVGTSSSTTFIDNNVSVGNAYLYRVCAADLANNCTSIFSNVALGAAVSFPTDPVITSIVDDPTGVNVTKVKLEHITELRTAVNAVRSLAGMPAATWTNLTLTRNVSPIMADDVRDLRIALHGALTMMGIATSPYDDATLTGAPNGTPIKKVHITQLRARGRSGIGGSGGSANSPLILQWLVTDHLGTPRMIFDKTGSLANVKRNDYLPFGEELTNQGLRPTTEGYSATDNVRQKFTSKERDNETGLDYFLVRYYSSPQGRFTSADPLLSSGTIYDPQTWNRYSYTLNNPLKYVDPFGLYEWDASLGGSATDDELRKRKGGGKIIGRRNDFRNALADANRAAGNKSLTERQRADIARSVGAYGAEGEANGVSVATGKVKDGAAAETIFGKDNKGVNYLTEKGAGNYVANIVVTFGGSIDTDAVAHEGSHVADRQELVTAILVNTLISEQEINNLPQNITKYATEYRAYQVSSALNQAGGRPTEVWNRGWSVADRATAINKLLRTNSLYKVTPEKPGPRLLTYEKKK